MSVQAIILETGETIIADVTEAIDKAENKSLGYKLLNPFVINLVYDKPVETTEGLERKMTIAVPSERIENDVDLRLREAAKTMRLNGFRKGKVPYKVVKKKFGKGVRGEVIGELMSQSFYDAVSQENLKPAGQPKIEPLDTDEGKDLTFIAIFEVG